MEIRSISTPEFFDLEEKRVKREIIERGARRVLIQVPEGLRSQIFRVAETDEDAGAEPIVSADPCYGACDLALDEARNVGADLIIHYGHSELPCELGIPIIYVEARANLPVEDVIRKSLDLLRNYRKIGLVTTIQHIDKLSKARGILAKEGKEVLIGCSSRNLRRGQVIGCDFSNAVTLKDDVEVFLFIGGGRFHALGVKISTLKPTYVADPFTNSVYTVDEEVWKILRQRFACIVEARKAKKFGILLGLKTGQRRIDLAIKTAKMLRSKGKAALILALREITPEVLSQFQTIEAFVNTACPRISLDAAARFRVPVLSINEALVVLEEMSWEDLCRGGLLADSSWRW
ncbi:MAG: diphthamide biosynthesis enzyme Dph2 [Candidatus Bathyarchaeia archaeon]